MSGTGDEGPDMRAAEYVLGVLDAAEAAEAERRMEADPAFAAEVADWEQRLMPLTALVAPAAPPDSLWNRIEASIGKPAANDNRRWVWPAATLASLAVAASLAAFILLRPVPAPVVAVLIPASGGTPVLVAVAEPSGQYRVRATSAISVASDRDLELWALRAGATRPEPLGVIPPAGRETPGLPAGTMLLVSLEPKGGSPTGQPTGPVLYAGKLTRYD